MQRWQNSFTLTDTLGELVDDTIVNIIRQAYIAQRNALESLCEEMLTCGRNVGILGVHTYSLYKIESVYSLDSSVPFGEIHERNEYSSGG